jgi:hypothetical protein
MKFSCRSGVGRVTRAVICGLLAGVIIPAAASADGLVSGVATPVTTAAALMPVPTPSAPAVSVPTVSMPVAAAAVSALARKLPVSAAPTHAKTHSREQASRPAKTKQSYSTRSFMTADSFTGPFTPPVFPNPCIPTDVVTITGSVTTTVKAQPDGSFWFYQSYNGTGTSLPSGAKYAFSDEIHGAFTSPVGTQIRFYDYYKLYRQADIFSPLGGDDFFLRIYTEIPGSTGGGPSMNSLMAFPVGGECR